MSISCLSEILIRGIRCISLFVYYQLAIDSALADHCARLQLIFRHVSKFIKVFSICGDGERFFM